VVTPPIDVGAVVAPVTTIAGGAVAGAADAVGPLLP
jgi:hypothetical protein